MRTGKVGQLLKSADVLERHDHQTIEFRPAHHDHVIVDIHGNVGGSCILRTAASYQLRHCARLAFPGKRGALAGSSRQTLALIHVVPPLPIDPDSSHLRVTRVGLRRNNTATLAEVL